MNEATLYQRLGGYDGIAAVADNLMPRLTADAKLGRFWAHRGDDGLRREKQLLIDFLCSVMGGPMVYTGRDMKTTHAGMRINESDWSAFMDHLQATLDEFKIPDREGSEVISLAGSTKGDIAEC